MKAIIAKTKAWSVDDCQRNRIQIGYLCGENVYAWFDRPLERHEYRPFLRAAAACPGHASSIGSWPMPA